MAVASVSLRKEENANFKEKKDKDKAKVIKSRNNNFPGSITSRENKILKIGNLNLN